ncbi:MAG: histidine kinase [Pseudomonadota bacterium]|nr:histidine kinase [Pseudomonadota bacterium]
MNETAKNLNQRTFLPDFCNIRIVFAVVVIAELLAIVLTLASPGDQQDRWDYLSLASLFIQWIALLSTATLCLLRPLLARLDNNNAAIAAYGLLLLITLILSESAYWVSANVGSGSLSTPMGHLEFLGRNLAICAITSFIVLRYFYLQHQLTRRIEAENQFRLQALQARIQPHFLFNSLNTIASLIRRQPRQAEEAVADLADLFRHTLSDTTVRVSLAEELEITRRYLQIEQLRLGERLQMEWQIETLPSDATLPSLTLQPLLENAIYHGIENLTGGGIIKCQGSFDGKLLRLTITNPVAEQNGARDRPGLNMALDNISQRLQAHFEEQGRLTVSRPAGHYQVELQFPYVSHRNSIATAV